MSFLDRLEPFRRPAVTALYALYVIVLIVGITGGWDFATAVVVCLSLHIGGVALGLLVSGFDSQNKDHPWPGELSPRYRKFLKIVDAAQLVTLIVAATQIGSMPTVLEVLTLIIVGIGVVTCFVKFNMLKSINDGENTNSATDSERRMTEQGVVGLVFINTGGILIIAAIATLDGEPTVLGLFIGSLLSHILSSVLAGLTYRKASTYYRCPPSEDGDERRYIEWATIRYGFVSGGLTFLMLASMGAGSLWVEGGNVVSKNCALFASLFWLNGTALMHIMPNKKNRKNCESMHLAGPGEMYPVLGADPEV